MIGDVLQPTHLIFILVVALLVLGPKRLPEVGKSLGKGIRDFKGALSGLDEPAPSPQSTQPPPVTPVTAAPTVLPVEAAVAAPSAEVSPGDSVTDAVVEVQEAAPTAAPASEGSSAAAVEATPMASAEQAVPEQQPVASAPQRTSDS